MPSLIKDKISDNSMTLHTINTAPTWLDIRELKNDGEYSNQYEAICKAHDLDNKWILMINPESQAIENLTVNADVNTNKILRIHANKVNVSIENIQSALCKGNCAAIVLNDMSLKEEEISRLVDCAQKGRTQCIVMTKSDTLH